MHRHAERPSIFIDGLSVGADEGNGKFQILGSHPLVGVDCTEIPEPLLHCKGFHPTL